MPREERIGFRLDNSLRSFDQLTGRGLMPVARYANQINESNRDPAP